MPGATSTTLTTLIRPSVSPELSAVKYVNREFRQIMLTRIGVPIEQMINGSTYDWRILRGSGNSSVATYSEGQGAPAAGSQAYINPSLSPVSIWGVAQITGHALDAMGRFGGGNYVGLAEATWMGELTGLSDDIENLYNDTYIGSGANGILTFLDATGTFAGLARATYTDVVSYEEAGGSAALTIAMMRNTYEGFRDNDVNGKLPGGSGWIIPHNQVSNYVSLAQGTTTANFVRAVNEPMRGPAIDLGANMDALTFNGLPVYGCSDLTDTELLLVSATPGMWKFVVARPETSERLGKEDDSERVLVTKRELLVCTDPRHAGAKLSAVTA